MNNEFSLALRNIKKLVNPNEDSSYMKHKSLSTSQNNNGVHVSDYTDKEKSRNNIP